MTDTDVTTAPVRPDRRPGWPEVAVGLVTLFVLAFGVPAILKSAGLDPQPYGLALSALSGAAGLAAFAVASVIRRRSWPDLGVRRVSWRWLGLAVGLGLLCYPVKYVIGTLVALTGYTGNVQAPYYEGAAGGLVPALISILFLAVLTPIGEEFLFRGIVANAMLRVGPVVGVVGSALVFALAHGDVAIFGPALVVGLVAAELLRRTGSVWPGVVVHAVNNLGLPLLVLAGAR
jgi:uncharacterized protein